MKNYNELTTKLRTISRHAGEIIMRYYTQEQVVTRKDDNSPVTEADIAANDFIVGKLAELAPEIPIVSEEGNKPAVTGASYFWLVDPLDGTKSFIRREGEFTVNIGLIKQRQPVLGVIYIPAQEVCYWGTDGQGAWRQSANKQKESISARKPPEEGLSAVVSLSHLSAETREFMATLPVANQVQAASSLKFCRLAEGKADIYPRFAPTMEWDTAAGHAILAAAGGRVYTPDKKELTYGKPQFLNGNFIARGR